MNAPIVGTPSKVAFEERRGVVGKVLLEALIVAIVGALFGLLANTISPRGLVLGRNYFPGTNQASLAKVLRSSSAQGQSKASTGTTSSVEVITARLKARGLQVIDSNGVIQLFRSPQYAQELVVFIDGRADKDYLKGHVPGAYQLDHYHPEKYLGTVVPVCQTAEQIVVYCNGGDCEESEFTAVLLVEAGIQRTNLVVYAGGLGEWITNGLPVETGPRGSGQMQRSSP